VIRKLDIRNAPLTKSERDAIENLGRTISEQALRPIAAGAEDYVARLDQDLRNAQDLLTEETRKRQFLEDAKAELLEKLDRTVGGENGEATGEKTYLFFLRK
jgi:hypothetical protein